jgi:hypothetical protein
MWSRNKFRRRVFDMRTATGLFDTYSDAEAAVANLERAGINSDDISIVSNKGDGRYKDQSNAAEGAGAGAGVGALVGGTGGLLTGLGLMAIPGVGPVVAAGWLAATAVGAAAGAAVGGAAGGIIGALTKEGVSEIVLTTSERYCAPFTPDQSIPESNASSSVGSSK